MRFARERPSADFYESFSDLIFGTLVVFLVVVLALVLKVREATQTLEDLTGGIVLPHRFTGGADNPIHRVVVVLLDDEPLMGFLPSQLASALDASRSEGGNDPILAACNAFLDHRMGLIDAPTFMAMARGGLSQRFTAGSFVMYQASDIVLRMLAYERYVGGDLNAMSPRKMRDAIGGLSLWESGQPTRANFPYDQVERRFVNWHHLRGVEWGRVWAEIVYPKRDQVRRTPARGADIIFSVAPDRMITIGEATISPNAFRAMLSSIVPGADFIIEYRSPSGQIAQPPLWVETEILEPLGYTGRIVRDTPLDAQSLSQ